MKCVLQCLVMIVVVGLQVSISGLLETDTVSLVFILTKPFCSTLVISKQVLAGANACVMLTVFYMC